MEEYVKEAVEIINQELETLSKKIGANISVVGAYASGESTNSLEVQKLDFGGQLMAKKYFSVLETGKKASWTPIDPLIKWIKVKGLGGSEQEDLSFAIAISKTHKASGSKLFRSGGRTNVFTDDINLLIENITDIISEKLMFTVTKYITIDVGNKK